MAQWEANLQEIETGLGGPDAAWMRSPLLAMLDLLETGQQGGWTALPFLMEMLEADGWQSIGRDAAFALNKASVRLEETALLMKDPGSFPVKRYPLWPAGYVTSETVETAIDHVERGRYGPGYGDWDWQVLTNPTSTGSFVAIKRGEWRKIHIFLRPERSVDLRRFFTDKIIRNPAICLTPGLSNLEFRYREDSVWVEAWYDSRRLNASGSHHLGHVFMFCSDEAWVRACRVSGFSIYPVMAWADFRLGRSYN